jgi:DNA helicase-2/ATP-dependent DNA helicase PcrA
MYVGTIHGFCLKWLRELAPDEYHNYDILDEGARLALVQRGFHGILGLSQFQRELRTTDNMIGQYETIDRFLHAYDLLNEYGQLNVKLPSGGPPSDLRGESEWCKGAQLQTDVGAKPEAVTFGDSAARFYAYLRCRHFLDFSTSQSELVRLLESNAKTLGALRNRLARVVVDEVQDVNPIQDKLIRLLLGSEGYLTAVGDHRQAIYAWRGGRVQIMGALFEELNGDPTGEVIELPENFRSTPRIIDFGNKLAQFIGHVGIMTSPDMLHGRTTRLDVDGTHLSALRFGSRTQEAEWVASRVKQLVLGKDVMKGAFHDTSQGDRGLSYGDVAVLLRTATSARTYMTALERENIPAVFRAGPDLFSQPEVLLFLGILARMVGLEEFYGSQIDPRSLPLRIRGVLGCDARCDSVVSAACRVIRASGLPLAAGTEQRLLLASELVYRRFFNGIPPRPDELRGLLNPNLIDTLRRPAGRRVFPQRLYQLALAEADVGEWDSVDGRGQTAMFHLGALSTLVKGMETPGWNDPQDFKYQVIALFSWGSRNARTEEAPLLVEPDAVTISTIHGAKGLEYGAVFLADVNAQRFPSSRARTLPYLPFDGPILRIIKPADLCDNENYDGERRLMYVAVTRAERYLFVTCSGARQSKFYREVEAAVSDVGGAVGLPPSSVPKSIALRSTQYRRDSRLVTSFSDLRYYLECPHDFYLRKVLGFAPTIDQAFGYGRGVHNLLRAIHSDPAKWAALAKDPPAMTAALKELAQRGVFYLRYTTGEPLERMRGKALDIVGEYVQQYADELATLEFEPEREFETLIGEEGVLVSGAIDVVRLDDPPRVTLLDFKSGEAKSDIASKLDEDEMRLQISLYGIAAKHELEYEPERGLVRYLGERDKTKSELVVDLDDAALAVARATVVSTAREIRDRHFNEGPRRKPRTPGLHVRCAECDFLELCGRPEAKSFRTGRGASSLKAG